MPSSDRARAPVTSTADAATEPAIDADAPTRHDVPELAALGDLTPAQAAAMLARHPGDQDALVARLHERGNYFVQATLALVAGDAGTITAGAEPTPLVGTIDDVLGLARGDGMTAASAAIRPRVKELQRRLNACMDADLKIDGMYGPLTGRATREFQASLRHPAVEHIDALTAEALYGTAPPEVYESPPGEQREPDAALMHTATTATEEFGRALAPTADHLRDAGASCMVSSSAAVDAGPPLLNVARQLGGAWQNATTWPAVFKEAAGPNAAGPRVIGNRLVGLTQGDGLTHGTLDRRARVRALQEALNERGHGLVVDGKFGSKTRTALDRVRAGLAIPSSDIVDADTADHLLDQAAHTPDVGNPDAQRVRTAGAQLGQTAVDLRATAGAVSFASLDLSRSSDGADQQAGLALLRAGERLREVAAALMGLTALGAAETGPVGLIARQRLREMHKVTDPLGRAMIAAGFSLTEAGGQVQGAPAFAGTSRELTAAGQRIMDAANRIMDAGHGIAPVGPTGGGKSAP